MSMILEGAVDLDVHFGPEPFAEKISGNPTSVDPVQAAYEAAERGMAALVLNAFGRRGRLVVTHAMQQGASGPRLDKAGCALLAGLGAFIELTAHHCPGSPPDLDRVVRVRSVPPRVGRDLQ
jgi:hypothetical protein